jgi:class 3 adenylate cyclase/tetratricopeptide (TPR) repeat protein
MSCHRCGLEAQGGARFCGGCGASLSRETACEACSAPNPVAHGFCHSCGHALARPQAAAHAHGGERRQLTSLFCDFVGFTRLSTRLDVEDLQALMNEYYRLCTEVVERFGGHVSQLLGDGVFAYFGYPAAHEDAASRAVTAALSILDAMPAFRRGIAGRLAEAGDSSLGVRIGIHTGIVVVGDNGFTAGGEPVALGTSLNVASRLQAIAPENTVLITAATRNLVDGLFVLESIGELRLRGIEEAVGAYRVVRASGVGSRLEVAARAGLTPFIGREQELSLLGDRWEMAARGLGQAVLVTGEAGVGKSRLVQRLRESTDSSRCTWIEARCSPYHTNTAFHPIIDMIRHGIRADADDSALVRLDKLEHAIGDAGLPLEKTLPVLADLLSLPVAGGIRDVPQSAQAWRRSTLEGLLAWILALAARGPVVLVVEDLHWIDPSTLELLSMLMDRLTSTRVLVVLTARPELQPSPCWPQVKYLRLGALTRSQIRTMLGAVLLRRSLPASVVDELERKCDGVPLFVEELTKAVVESGPRAAGETGAGGLATACVIPATLRDSLTARLDRLGTARELAQIASVIGREFSHALLAQVAGLPGSSLDEAIETLVAAELFYRRGVAPHATYTFKHALLQDAAYEALLRSRRVELHAAIARILEERFPEIARIEPETVARHLAGAREYEAAAERYRQAAELAKERVANAEAIVHLGRALELIAKVPESESRLRLELRLHVALGAPLIATRGYAHEDTGRAFERARELCSQVGHADELFEAVYGHSAWSLNNTHMDEAYESSCRLLQLARQIPAPSRLPWAHQQMGCVHYFRGEPEQAQRHFDAAVGSYAASEHRPFLHVFGQDASVASMALGGMTRWLLGRPAEAIATSRAAVARARELGHPFSLAFAMSFLGYNLVQRRERSAVEPVARELGELVREQGLSVWIPSSLVLAGWAKQNPREAIETIRSGMMEGSRLGSRIGAPFYVGMLADRQLEAGELDDARMTTLMALTVAAETENHYWDVELHRMLGDIELASGGAAETAKASYARALDIAQAQGAKGPARRAALSMSRLMVREGEKQRARSLLDVHWQLSGLVHGTHDEAEASQLLEQLA